MSCDTGAWLGAHSCRRWHAPPQRPAPSPCVRSGGPPSSAAPPPPPPPLPTRQSSPASPAKHRILVTFLKRDSESIAISVTRPEELMYLCSTVFYKCEAGTTFLLHKTQKLVLNIINNCSVHAGTTDHRTVAHVAWHVQEQASFNKFCYASCRRSVAHSSSA